MDRIQRINEGNMSAIALNFFGNVLKTQQSALLNRIMVDYRSGKADNTGLLGFVAGYTALEDLFLALKRNVDNANKLNKESIDNGIKSPHNE